jgi:hypothetical protein
MRLLPIFLISALLGGCAFSHNSKPALAYQPGAYTNSQTAVFSALGAFGSTVGQISQVDGMKMACLSYGCPSFVRVPAGKHTFTLNINVYDQGIFRYKHGEVHLVIDDMEPRHVYELTFSDNGDRFAAGYRDVGKDPDYGIRLGLSGVNQKYFPITFDDN